MGRDKERTGGQRTKPPGRKPEDHAVQFSEAAVDDLKRLDMESDLMAAFTRCLAMDQILVRAAIFKEYASLFQRETHLEASLRERMQAYKSERDKIVHAGKVEDNFVQRWLERVNDPAKIEDEELLSAALTSVVKDLNDEVLQIRADVAEIIRVTGGEKHQ